MMPVSAPGNLPFLVAREHMGLGARFMKRKTVSRSLLFVVVAVAVIALAIPALANPAPSVGTLGVFASLNNNIPGSFLLKHDSWGDKYKHKDKWCGDKPNPCAVPEEPSLVQMGLLLALFAVVIPKAVLAGRKA